MWYNLLSDEARQNTEFIYNLSYGKDSILNEPPRFVAYEGEQLGIRI